MPLDLKTDYQQDPYSA
ncbi:hypothetical protein CGSHi22121_07890 [Haemophilus influenzae 22.1-21]|nr:hypothetical protein CGSHi22121_07890 [Haemophilus influenzae 22.1-21]